MDRQQPTHFVSSPVRPGVVAFPVVLVFLPFAFVHCTTLIVEPAVPMHLVLAKLAVVHIGAVSEDTCGSIGMRCSITVPRLKKNSCND